MDLLLEALLADKLLNIQVRVEVQIDAANRYITHDLSEGAPLCTQWTLYSTYFGWLEDERRRRYCVKLSETHVHSTHISSNTRSRCYHDRNI